MLNANMQAYPQKLFRFSKRRWLEELQTRGRFRFSHARTFLEATSLAQRDNEQARVFRTEPLAQQIEHFRGRDVNPLAMSLRWSLVGKTGKPLDYYMLCFALQYDEILFRDFSADSCLKINDPKAFCDRAEASCRKDFPDCDFFASEVSYYSEFSFLDAFAGEPLLFRKREGSEGVFRRQNEYRLVFAIVPALSSPDYLEFEAGSMSDIAEFHVNT